MAMLPDGEKSLRIHLLILT